MGSWKGTEEYDEEADRLSRQAAAFGADTSAPALHAHSITFSAVRIGLTASAVCMHACVRISISPRSANHRVLICCSHTGWPK